MILLLGASGYVGQEFARELRRRGLAFIPLSRQAFDYGQFELLFDYVRSIQPKFLINASGYSGTPNLDACEANRMKTFQTNTLLPQTIARVCTLTKTPFGHVSSGGIYSGAKIFENGSMRVERSLNRPEVRRLFEQHPERFFGFTELDEPNFSFRSPPCSFLAGTQTLAEEALRNAGNTYLWRAPLLFDDQDHPSNLLNKLTGYTKVLDHLSTFAHLGDFVRAALDLYEFGAPCGIYNIINPGASSTREIVQFIQNRTESRRRFEFWSGEDEFYADERHAPRAFNLLDGSKLLRSGVRMRPLKTALNAALATWCAGKAATVVRKEFEPTLVSI